VNYGGATAPGKALLCGEYAVLEGGKAVVAAVDRRVKVSWTTESDALPPEVEATLRFARERLGPLPTSVRLDASELQTEGVKLGLGSSAARAVAAAGAAFDHYGHELRDNDVRHEVFECALVGHASVAPKGSGVDVAGATFGGFLGFARDEHGIRHAPLERPTGLVLRLVWTGQPARTSDLVDCVNRFRQKDPHGYRTAINRLISVAGRFAQAFEARSTQAVLEHAAAYADAMQALGNAAGAPIVEDRLQSIRKLAERFSGSAKPCGAGGGDVAVAFFVDRSSADRFESACRSAGLHPIEVSWGAIGVSPCVP
jgi:phosphomevalonate kinase